MYRYRIQQGNVSTYTPWRPTEIQASRDLDTAAGTLRLYPMASSAVHIMGSYDTMTGWMEWEEGEGKMRQADA